MAGIVSIKIMAALYSQPGRRTCNYFDVPVRTICHFLRGLRLLVACRILSFAGQRWCITFNVRLSFWMEHYVTSDTRRYEYSLKKQTGQRWLVHYTARCCMAPAAEDGHQLLADHTEMLLAMTLELPWRHVSKSC